MGILSVLWLLPAISGLVCLLADRLHPRLAPRLALSSAAASFGYAVWLAAAYGSSSDPWVIAEMGPEWIFGMRYLAMADGLSLSLCALTALLTVVSLLASWRQPRSAGYWSCFLLLEGALMGVFLARDLFLFFLFWEATLIPMYFIIGVWGSDNRRHAAMKFFLFTFSGSFLLLLGILALVTLNHRATGAWTWDMGALKGDAAGPAGLWIFLAFVAGFGVKIPLVPFHTWLPDAHTEAPAGGSIMLAGVMLKMGVYGFLRVLMPVFPELFSEMMPYLGFIAAVNVIYGSLCAMAQKDLKRLVAYSSVAHLGFCLLGILSRKTEGLAGGSLQLINHGLTTGCLFLLVGFLYERAHKRGLGDFGALALRAPWMTFFFGFTVLASIGLPGLNGFVGEFMSLAGMMRELPVLAIAGAAGIILSAAYSLPAFQAVFWNDEAPGSVSAKVTDLTPREQGLAWTLAALMLAIGLYPAPLLRFMEPALSRLAL